VLSQKRLNVSGKVTGLPCFKDSEMSGDAALSQPKTSVDGERMAILALIAVRSVPKAVGRKMKSIC